MNTSEAIDELRVIASFLPNVDITFVQKEFDGVSKLPLTEQYRVLSQLCSAQGNCRPHPDWFLLSGRIRMAGIRREVAPTFSEATLALKSFLVPEYVEFVIKHADALNALVVQDRDNVFNDFSIETLAKSYLVTLSNNGVRSVMETPQYLFMRVATFLYYNHDSPEDAIVEIKSVYDSMSQAEYIHASPTLYNSALLKHQLSSCFTLEVEDALVGKSSITDTWTTSAIISSGTGAIGIDLSNLRHSEIGGMGSTRGIVPWVKIMNDIMKAVDQGSKRKGAATMYLPCWHLDVLEFIDLRLPTGPEEMRAPDLSYALWISDEFMRRVRDDKMWTMFCPNKAKGLSDVWGEEFDMKYLDYEEKARKGQLTNHKTIRARDLFHRIIDAQIKAGMPYMLYKDACNRKSNQQNLGTIRLSNLCVEVLLFVDKDNIGSCNLASVALNAFITQTGSPSTYSGTAPAEYDYEKLGRAVEQLVRNINQVIDRNCYPKGVPAIQYTNMRNRPIGIGVQGLANAFALLDLEWESSEAQKVNELIFETMYYHAVKESIALAKEHGPYITFRGGGDSGVSAGSPASKGKFQFDLWDDELYDNHIRSAKVSQAVEDTISTIEKASALRRGPASNRYDWETLRNEMKVYGLRNSLLIALMPTATCSNILGNNEAFEPFTHNVYSRSVLSGQFTVLNKHMVRDLEALDMWSTPVIRQIWKDGGSLKNLPIEELEGEKRERAIFLKRKYKCTYEISQKVIMKMMLDRGRYVCQSQSFNYFCANPTYPAITAFHFAAWKGGAKTGMYYLRQLAASNPHNISLDHIKAPRESSVSDKPKKAQKALIVCNDEVCMACS